MNTVMVVTLKNDLTDYEIQIIRDEICQEMLRARELSAADIKIDGMVDDADMELKLAKKLKLQLTEGSSISRSAALGRKFTNGNKLDKVGFSINSEVQDDDSDGEESSNSHTSEANDADEHDEIQRNWKGHERACEHGPRQ